MAALFLIEVTSTSGLAQENKRKGGEKVRKKIYKTVSSYTNQLIVLRAKNLLTPLGARKKKTCILSGTVCKGLAVS